MSTAELVEQIDAKWTKDGWAVHRRYDGQWMVHGQPQGTVLYGQTIEDALRAAAEYVPLPEIPRRPQIRLAGNLEPKKDGSKWRLWDTRSRSWYPVLTPTKREALAARDTIYNNELRAQQNWDIVHSPTVAKGTEGVDFRYVD